MFSISLFSLNEWDKFLHQKPIKRNCWRRNFCKTTRKIVFFSPILVSRVNSRHNINFIREKNTWIKYTNKTQDVRMKYTTTHSQIDAICKKKKRKVFLQKVQNFSDKCKHSCHDYRKIKYFTIIYIIIDKYKITGTIAQIIFNTYMYRLFFFFLFFGCFSFLKKFAIKCVGIRHYQIFTSISVSE